MYLLEPAGEGGGMNVGLFYCLILSGIDNNNDDSDEDDNDNDDGDVVDYEDCSAQTVTRIGLLEEIPRSGVQIPCLS
jgi:hypothetical protein